MKRILILLCCSMLSGVKLIASTVWTGSGNITSANNCSMGSIPRSTDSAITKSENLDFNQTTSFGMMKIVRGAVMVMRRFNVLFSSEIFPNSRFLRSSLIQNFGSVVHIYPFQNRIDLFGNHLFSRFPIIERRD